jgi:hypothetical protein
MRALFFAVVFLFVIDPSRAATISVTPLSGSDVSLIMVQGDLATNDHQIFRQKAAAINKANRVVSK